MSCATLAAGHTHACEAQERVGGLLPYFYLGNQTDLTGYTLNGTSFDVTALTLDTGKKLYKVEGVQWMNAMSIEMQKGTVVNQYKHNLDFVLMSYKGTEHNALIDLLRAKNLFAIVPGADKRFEIIGLDFSSGDAASPVAVLEAETATNDSGKGLNERTHWAVRLSGMSQDITRFFNEGTAPYTFADNKAYLDALL